MGKTDPEAPRHAQQSHDPGAAGRARRDDRADAVGLSAMTMRRTAMAKSCSRTSACRSRICCSAKGAGSRSRRGGSGRAASITACARSASPRTAIEAMAKRLLSRVAFGKRIADHSVWEQRIARARIDIEMTRLLCLKAADMMDKAGNKAAQLEIAMIKVQAPQHGAADPRRCDPGAWRRRRVASDFGLAHAWAAMRTLRFADGPDEVHNRAIARIEFGKYAELPKADRGQGRGAAMTSVTPRELGSAPQARVRFAETPSERGVTRIDESSRPVRSQDSRSQIEDVTVSKPGPHEVLIRTAACGVCRSDLHFVDGAYPHPCRRSRGMRRRAWSRRSAAKCRTVKVGDHVVTCLVGVLRALRILRHRPHVAVHRCQRRGAPKGAAAAADARTSSRSRQMLNLSAFAEHDAGPRTCLRRDRPRHAARPRRADRLRGDDRRGGGVQRQPT